MANLFLQDDTVYFLFLLTDSKEAHNIGDANHIKSVKLKLKHPSVSI